MFAAKLEIADLMLILIIVLVLLLVGHIAGTKKFRANQERKRLRQEWAEQNGYEMADPVNRRASPLIASRYGVSKTFIKDYARLAPMKVAPGRAFDVVQGQRNEFRFTLFDYVVKPNASTPLPYSVIVLEVPMLIPSFTLRPKMAWHQQLGVKKGEERLIDFPGLGQSLVLEAPDNTLALNSLTHEFFMEVVKTGAVRWMSTGRRLTMVRVGQLSEDKLEELLDGAITVARMLLERPVVG
ncbi:MAG: hypothetical protein KF784_14915 [Fimbriimonadaceae bacterium]|nr:hypothetical protein [Fimbriimonadaceae bacterium]